MAVLLLVGLLLYFESELCVRLVVSFLRGKNYPETRKRSGVYRLVACQLDLACRHVMSGLYYDFFFFLSYQLGKVEISQKENADFLKS
jgi:hypothetical protein